MLTSLIVQPKDIMSFKLLILHMGDWLNETMKNTTYSEALWGEQEDTLRTLAHIAI